MYQRLFLLYTFLTLVKLHAKLGLILTTSWPDDKELFLIFARTRNSRNSQNSKWKTNIFPRQVIPKILLLYPLITLVIFHATIDGDLDNSLTRWKRIFSKNSKNSHFAKFAKFRMKNQFFSRQAIPKVFLPYIFITLVIVHTEFGLFWTTPWPDEEDLFFNIPFSRNSKVPYEILTFFLGKMYQKFFLLYTFITLVTLHTKLGLILTTSWPGEKQLFLKFARIRNSRNSQNTVWKTNIFFSRQVLPKFLLFYPLITLVIFHAAVGLI